MPPNQPPGPPPLASYRPSNERQPQGQAFPPRPRPGGAPGRGGVPPHRLEQGGGGGGGFVRGLLFAVLALLLIAGAGIGYLVLNPPSDLIRAQLAEQVKARTGRDLVISGPAKFSFYPGLGVSLEDVALSGPDGSDAKLVTMKALNVAIKPLPLLQRQVLVDTLLLKEPVFDLRVDKNGKRNWDFAEDAARVQYAQAAAPAGKASDAAPAPAAASRLEALNNFQLEDVRIENATIRYADARNGAKADVSAINAKLALPSLDAPFSAAGDLAWNGERVGFDATLTDARAILSQKPAKLAFKANAKSATATYDGSVRVKDGADLDGQIALQSESARDLAQWLGTILPPAAGFGPLSVNGALKTSGNVTTLSNANISLDGATATGTLSATTGGVRPYVQANLKITELDLNKYMTAPGSQPIAADKPAPAAQPAPSPAPAPAKPKAGAPQGDDIEKLLNSQGGKVYGATQRAGWSSEAINLGLLGTVDADAKVQATRLLWQNVKVGPAAMTVGLKNRVLKAAFDDVQLYDGRGHGTVTLDGTADRANLAATAAFDGVSALPLLTDAAGMKFLSGKAKTGFQITANGASQLQLVETLSGKADLHVANGSVAGFNVQNAVSSLSQGKISGLKSSPSEKTDFSQLSATFTIANGIATNQDLQLVSPALTATGAGTVSLPPRTLDYTVRPKLAAAGDGQAGGALSGLEVPVRISGSWDKPSFDADLKGVLADPGKAVDTAKEIGKRFKGKDAGQIVDELTGKDGGASGNSAKELLKKFLKPQ